MPELNKPKQTVDDRANRVIQALTPNNGSQPPLTDEEVECLARALFRLENFTYPKTGSENQE